MRRILRFINALLALLSVLTLLRPRSGTLRLLLWIPKSMAESMTPVLALLSALGAGLGLILKDGFASLLGLFSFGTSLRHVVRVTADHGEFERVFGTGWEARIPAAQHEAMLRARWSPRLPSPARVPWERDVVIGTNIDCGEPIWVDIWKPPEGIAPTGVGLIYLHGSGWHFTDKDVRTRRLFRHLAGQGHVIMDVAYTLAPQARMRGMVGDVKQSIAWLKTQSDKYGVDPERIVLMGASAGGHLALISAYTPNDPQYQHEELTVDTSVRAVISFYGPTDLVHQHDYFSSRFTHYPGGSTRAGRALLFMGERWARKRRFLPSYGSLIKPRDILPNVIGGTPEEMLEKFRLWSPLYHIGEHCPTTLLIQGMHDFVGMHPDVRHFYETLLDAGVPTILVEFPNTEHAFDILSSSRSPATQAALYDLERFLFLVGQEN